MTDRLVKKPQPEDPELARKELENRANELANKFMDLASSQYTLQEVMVALSIFHVNAIEGMLIGMNVPLKDSKANATRTHWHRFMNDTTRKLTTQVVSLYPPDSNRSNKVN